MQSADLRSSQAIRVRSGSRRGTKARSLSTAIACCALLVAQLLWPLAALAAESPATAFVPIAQTELASVYGGCLNDCDGGDDSSGGDDDSAPSKVGYPYWEFSHRTLISRPAVAGNLIWHRVNDTDQAWGPFDVTYRYQSSFNWSLSGSVPRSTVQAHIGGAYEVERTITEKYLVPARTYYKLFVAYPYERWRYYYEKYQDYSDDSRESIASGSATVYDQWTKTTLVQGPVY